MKVKKCLFLLVMFFLLSAPAFAQEVTPSPEPAKVDKDYIRKYYPEVYQQILSEGKESASKEIGKQEAVMTKPADATNTKEVAAPRKETLGDWWNRNSLEYEPRPSQLLYHAELQYGFSRDTGNVSAYSHKGAGKFIVRLDGFTNSLSYLIDKGKQVNVTSGGETIKDYQIFEEALRYDITKKLYSMGGLIREVNKDEMLDTRYAFYGGLGYPLLALKGHKLDFFLAYAYVDEKYASFINTILGFSGRRYSSVYFNQTYKWSITDRILFSERFRIIHSLEDSTHYDMDAAGNIVDLGKKKRDLIIFALGLDFKLTDSVTFFNKYQLNYDNAPWPTVRTKDASFSSGVRLSF